MRKKFLMKKSGMDKLDDLWIKGKSKLDSEEQASRSIPVKHRIVTEINIQTGTPSDSGNEEKDPEVRVDQGVLDKVITTFYERRNRDSPIKARTLVLSLIHI